MSRCRTIDPGSSDKTFKETILQVCRDRSDQWAKDVELRVLGAVSDLHAADARYHRDCKPSFMGPKALKLSAKSGTTTRKDSAFDQVVRLMESDKNKLWSSTELHNAYVDRDGNRLQRRTLVDAIAKHFGEHLLLLSCKGIATLLVFRTRASELVKLEEDVDDDHQAIQNVARLVRQESKAIEIDTKSYSSGINEGIARAETSSTILALLSEISPRLSGSLTSLLIGNMITNVVTNRPTALQVALGVAVREKSMINTLHDFSVTCSYDEVLRFKTSAAHSAAETSNSQGLFNANEGLIQVVIDNYDANISSLNGLKSTHALAMLMCQSTSGSNLEAATDAENRIPRISKADMKLPIDDVRVQHYQGPKAPPMPALPAVNPTQNAHIQRCQSTSLARARELDLQFLKSVTASENVAEYGGHITRVAREQDHVIRPATTTRYRPLIDLNPSDPSTIKTALLEAQSLTTDCGQQFVVITADQQLYKVILDNIWATPEIFSNIFPRLGGLHTIMSFCGSVGKLMMDSGLSEILRYAFGGVEKMLSGKKYPQNVRAFRLLAEELLRKSITETDSTEEFEQMLVNASCRSKTTKLWVDCFIHPVLIMMAFTRAERESDWPLHLWSVSQMMPYFFAAGHVNYARYGLYYLRSMESLPQEVQAMFLKGLHTMRHIPGASNSTWSDMYIESTFMRYGHSQGGLTGLTLSGSATQRWALSLHACSVLEHDLQVMRDRVDQPPRYHKEESAGRMRTDAADRLKLKQKLEHCIDPLDPTGHPEELFNVVTGQVASTASNVHKALELGKESLHAYEKKLPDGFHAPISCPVTTMATKRKRLQLQEGVEPAFDTEVIFIRTLGLMNTMDFNLKDLFDFELSQIPTSLFTDDGNLRPATAKSKLKKAIEVEQSLRITPDPQVLVLDGCAILWTLHWPVPGTVEDLITAMETYLRQKLSICDVYLIFDRYYPLSTKGCTRSQRSSSTAVGPYHFTTSSALPSQSACLSIVDNKVQLIRVMCDALLDRFQQKVTPRKLVITGPDPVPHVIEAGAHTRRQDMSVKHEEGDVIIVNQVVRIARETQSIIHVVCDDTDVFILLVHFYASENLHSDIFMVPTRSARSVVNIGATAKENEPIAKHLLSVHALTGCDTTSTLYGIGKLKALKSLRNKHVPPHLGDKTATIDDLERKAVSFIATCYGSEKTSSMSEVRYNIWQHKTARGKSQKFKLASLPPSSAAFRLHVQRAQYQACLWTAALDSEPPEMNAADYGWKADPSNRNLLPVTLPSGTMVAPKQVLNLLCCNCSSTEACSTRRCTCRKSELACSIFCKCNASAGLKCANPLNKTTDDDLSDMSDDDNDDVE